jgi:methyl-accepting chemotaxis protein
MKKSRMNSIFTKVLVVALICMLVPMLFSLYYSSRTSTAYLKDDANSELATVTTAKQTQLESMFSAHVRMATLMANDVAVVDLFKLYKAGSSDRAVEQRISDAAKKFFDEAAGLYENIAYMYHDTSSTLQNNITMIDGIGGASVGTTFDDAAMSNDSDFFTDPRPRVGQVMFSPISGKPSVILSAPILDDRSNAMLGCILLPIDLNTLSSEIINSSLSSNAVTMLVNTDGLVISSPDETQVLTLDLSVEEGDLNDFFVSMGNNPSGSGYFSMNGVKQIATYSKSDMLNLYVVTYTPESSYMARINRLSISLITVMIISAVIATVLIVLLSLSITKPLKKLTGIASKISEGELDVSVDIKSRDETGQLAESISKTVYRLKDYMYYIDEIADVLRHISEGNLVFELKQDYTGEFEKVKTALEKVRGTLSEMLLQISTTTNEVSNAVDLVSNGAQTLASGASEQASAMEQLTSTVAQVSDDVQRNAENVNLAFEYIGQAGSGVRQSNEYMNALLQAMSAINESSSRISGIIKIIDDISFQTNILALNAAVEAARAGQAGKGFAVVAEEVRSLASRSANAAKQTSELITSSISSIKEGMRLAESTSAALADVGEKSRMVEVKNGEIRDSSNAQAAAISEIRKGLDQVSVVIQTITATAQENAAASEELASQAQTLHAQTSKFRVSAGDDRPLLLLE